VKKAGLVSLIGAGPGDPELITLRGLRALKSADVVVYDRLAAPELLLHARADAELIDVGKSAGDHVMPQPEITALLVRKGLEGKVVARLKGGDPFLFGRGGEEMAALAEAGVPFEVVPGVTAASGAAAYCGMPLTVRRVSAMVTLVTGHEDPTKGRSDVDWGALAKTGGTLVIYMGMGSLPKIASELMDGGIAAETPVAIVRRATTPRQETLEAPLGDIAEAVRERGIGPPALIVVGKVAGIEPKHSWFQSLPLFGRRIVVTRSRAQASVLVQGLRELGAEALELPTIEIAPPEDAPALDAALRELESYDYVFFTSTNTVDAVGERLGALGLDSRRFGNARVCAIGAATAAALTQIGLRADVVPEKVTAEGLLAALEGEDVAGKRVLLPRAAEAREVLPDGMRSRGATVDVVEAYRTVRPSPDGDAKAALQALTDETADLVTFSSSSTASNLAELLGNERQGRGVPAASIGPITSKTARGLGFEVVAEPETHTIAALIESIGDYFLRLGPAGPAPAPLAAPVAAEKEKKR